MAARGRARAWNIEGDDPTLAGSREAVHDIVRVCVHSRDRPFQVDLLPLSAEARARGFARARSVNFDNYDRLAVVSMQLGNLEDALEQLRQATRLEQSVYLYDDLGLAYFNLNRLDEADRQRNFHRPPRPNPSITVPL